MSFDDYGCGKPQGCQGINCGHYMTPFIVGINKKSEISEEDKLSEEELVRNANAQAKQRAFEREIRKSKELINISKIVNDKELEQKHRLRVKTLQSGLKQHIEKNPFLYRDTSRERVTGKYKANYHKYLPQSANIKISKKDTSNAMTVDRKLVNSKKYRDKFEKLPVPKKVKQNLYIKSKQILEHRDGTQGEDLYVLDAKTGKTIVKNISSKENSKVSLTKEQYDKVISNKNDVILLHNHPQGSRLSKTDIFTIFRNENIVGSMVAGHDGEIHYIYDINRKVDVEKIYKKYYTEAKELGLPETARNNYAMDKIYESGAFKYEKQ